VQHKTEARRPQHVPQPVLEQPDSQAACRQGPIAAPEPAHKPGAPPPAGGGCHHRPRAAVAVFGGRPLCKT